MLLEKLKGARFWRDHFSPVANECKPVKRVICQKTWMSLVDGWLHRWVNMTKLIIGNHETFSFLKICDKWRGVENKRNFYFNFNQYTFYWQLNVSKNYKFPKVTFVVSWDKRGFLWRLGLPSCRVRPCLNPRMLHSLYFNIRFRFSKNKLWICVLANNLLKKYAVGIAII